MSKRGSGGSRSSSRSSSRNYSSSTREKQRQPQQYAPPRQSASHTKETVIIREAPRGRQPGLFGTMAATAGGVAVGSAVGHAVGEAITGGGGRPAEAQAQQAPAQSYGPSEPTGPCAWEIKQFLQCAQNNDLSACDGFNEALRACKQRNGMK